MEIYHKEEIIDGVSQIVLYVKYPSDYEFGLDFDSIKKNVLNVSDKIREYALKSMNKISDNTVLMVLNGVVVGTILVSNLAVPKTQEVKQTPETEIVQPQEINKTIMGDNVDNPAEILEETKLEVAQVSEDKKKEGQNSGTITKEVANSAKKPSVPEIEHEVSSEKKIRLRLNTGKVIQIGLEEYVVRSSCCRNASRI